MPRSEGSIAYDVDRLMTHLLDNQYRIIDLNGEVTQYGHVGMDPDPARDDYYQTVYERTRRVTAPAEPGGLRSAPASWHCPIC